MDKDLKKILVDLHAARAFLNRVERQFRDYIGDTNPEIAPDDEIQPSSAFETPDKENTHVGYENSKESRFCPVSCDSPCFTQGELFGGQRKQRKNERKTAKTRKYGNIALSRSQVLANFRKFAAGKQLLDLADVNRILGYNKCTSGSFVKLAVKRGELLAVPVGKEVKFLPIDLREFVKSYFDRQDKDKGL